jgi:hypothetical protein
MVRPNARTASACEHRAAGHCPCVRPLWPRRTVRALAGREGKRFSPFEALAIFKLQKTTAVDDPVTEALRAVDLMYSANTKGTKQAASAAEMAKNGAKRAQVLSLCASSRSVMITLNPSPCLSVHFLPFG